MNKAENFRLPCVVLAQRFSQPPRPVLGGRDGSCLLAFSDYDKAHTFARKAGWDARAVPVELASLQSLQDFLDRAPPAALSIVVDSELYTWSPVRLDFSLPSAAHQFALADVRARLRTSQFTFGVWEL